jgi:molecular chaperone GrpE
MQEADNRDTRDTQDPNLQPQNESSAAPEAPTAPESLPPPDFEAELTALRAEADKHRDAWLRAVADADNARKRAEERIANAQKFAVESFSSELLGVKDSLEAALAVENASVESYRNGVELTLKQLASVFAKFNITEINPVGEKFDPHRHQAINMVESEAEANTIVLVLQKGYALNDRVLRPALVTVAKPKSAA